MTKTTSAASSLLPEIVITRNGACFDPKEDRWVFREAAASVSLDFTSLQAERLFVESAKCILAWYAENRSSDHLKNLFSRLKHFCRVHAEFTSASVRIISAEDLINYRATLCDRTQWYFSNLAGFLAKWFEFGHFGVHESSIEFIRQVRKKGNFQGEAVQTMDPFDGPYSDLEFEDIQEKLKVALATETITLSEYVLVLLFQLLGQRPVQYASLKLVDLHVNVNEHGESVFLIKIPRAKQRNALARSVFTPRLLLPAAGEFLIRHVELVKKILDGKVTPIENSPMFPVRKSSRNEPEGFEFHKTARSLAFDLQKILDKLKVMSLRTGELLHPTATRFRRTIGTRAAAEGHGERVIAELLDHSNTHNVGVYTKFRPEIAERIDRAIAMQLAPLAQAFAGKIIDGDSDAIRAGDHSSHIVNPKIDSSMQPMGSCGTHSFCQLAAPVSCYTCINFQPWLDGPHENVLSFLIDERERFSAKTDMRIASINDRTILAVAQVVQQCAEIKAARGVLYG